MALAVSLLIQVMGERLTTRLRDMAFRNIMRMDIAWFDKEENSTGAITARLATEVTLVKVCFGERTAWRAAAAQYIPFTAIVAQPLTAHVSTHGPTTFFLLQNVTGQNLGRSLQNVVTVCAAFTIAFVFGSWRMSVVLLGVLPLMVLGSFAQMKALRQNTERSQENVAKAGAVAVQAISGIRTVTAFGMNSRLMGLYSDALRRPMVLGVRNAILRGFTLGMSQFVTLAAYGTCGRAGVHACARVHVRVHVCGPSFLMPCLLWLAPRKTTLILGVAE